MKVFRNFLLALIVVLVAGHAFHYGSHKSVGFFIWSVQKDPETGKRGIVRTPPGKAGDNDGGPGEIVADTGTGDNQGDSPGTETPADPQTNLPPGPEPAPELEPEPEPAPPPPPPPPPTEFTLFDGKELGKWQPIQFGGEGAVTVNEDDFLEFDFGAIMTGVHWSEDPPASSNYQIDLDAMKLDGNDFFCALTFPVKDSHATLIIGGWGGGVVGISSVDDLDASENETMNIEGFETGVWYHVRVRVTDAKIECWLDDRQMVDLELTDRKISLRPGDIELCVPLGIASFVTRAQYKNILWKNLTEEDLANPPEPPPAPAAAPEPAPAPARTTPSEPDPAPEPAAETPAGSNV